MGAELSHQDREMWRGRPEMGAAYMHTKKAGAGETRQIRKGSVFISKHISPLIEWPPQLLPPNQDAGIRLRSRG